MSDLSRHNEATSAEELRHGEAQEAEMALHNEQSNTPEESAAHVTVLDRRIELANAGARRATAIAFIGGVVVVLVSLAVTVLVLLDNRSDANANGKRIDALTAELAAAREQIADNDQAKRDRDQCQATLQANVRLTGRTVTATTAAVIKDLGDLVVVISTTPIADRVAQVTTIITQLQLDGAAAQAALDANLLTTNAINAWSVLPILEQLPCPVPLAQ